MRRSLRTAGPPAIVYAACAVSFALGLLFIFVWTPLPWGWHGIDFYYENAMALARGESFATTKIMWGYAYFLAPWYRLFGDRPWIPLTVQTALNASIPAMLYFIARREIGERVAIVAAGLCAVLSFNTIYASTQASDAVCTTLFAGLMLVWGMALRSATDSDVRLTVSPAALFALSGVLAGLAYQFRPNLILYPIFLSAILLAVRPLNGATLRHVAIFLGLFAATGLPWVIHAYRSTGLLIPASTHGGRQLWFGTLQTGAYRQNWLDNPRAVLENPIIEYTSLDDVPLIVSGRVQPCAMNDIQSIELRYWTSRDPGVRSVPVSLHGNRTFELSVAPPQAPASVSFYFVVKALRNGQPIEMFTPLRGQEDPQILVVTRDHLGDLDVGSQWLDLFDVIRLTRHVTWGDALPSDGRLDLNHDGAVDESDLRRAVAILANPDEHAPDQGLASINTGLESATLRLIDGSTIEIPRAWDGRISSIVVRGELAARIATRSRTFASLVPADPPRVRHDPSEGCFLLEEAGINRVLARAEPHDMRRFSALALDNIKREPVAFVLASLERAFRLFLVEGGADPTKTVQFEHSPTVYTVARMVSIGYLGLFVCGVVLAIVRRQRLIVLLAPIIYVPATICPMLVTSRYSTTMQPFIFVFMAVALVEARDWIGRRGATGRSIATSSLR